MTVEPRRVGRPATGKAISRLTSGQTSRLSTPYALDIIILKVLSHSFN